jgi:hypothetical protein
LKRSDYYRLFISLVIWTALQALFLKFNTSWFFSELFVSAVEAGTRGAYVIVVAMVAADVLIRRHISPGAGLAWLALALIVLFVVALKYAAFDRNWLYAGSQGMLARVFQNFPYLGVMGYLLLAHTVSRKE